MESSFPEIIYSLLTAAQDGDSVKPLQVSPIPSMASFTSYIQCSSLNSVLGSMFQIHISYSKIQIQIQNLSPRTPPFPFSFPFLSLFFPWRCLPPGLAQAPHLGFRAIVSSSTLSSETYRFILYLTQSHHLTYKRLHLYLSPALCVPAAKLNSPHPHLVPSKSLLTNGSVQLPNPASSGAQVIFLEDQPNPAKTAWELPCELALHTKFIKAQLQLVSPFHLCPRSPD